MALQLVPPQPSEEDSASNEGGSAEPCFADDSTDLTDDSAPNRRAAHGGLDDHGLENDDDNSWITPRDMAILKGMGTEVILVAGANLQQPCIKWLPAGTKPVKLIGEGAANAVFEIKVPTRDRAGQHFSGLLLRVAKVPLLGATPTYDYLSQQQYFEHSIKPLLGDYTVHQELVILRRTGIVQELNNFLREINHTRKDKFKGSFVGPSDWGFLVEDMRPTETCELVEFKPKWLSQSPTAPRDAIRCRQCAIELRNLVRDLSRSRACPERKPCPMALISADGPWEVVSPFRMAPQLAVLGNGGHYENALRNIANHDAIHLLKEQQDIHDEHGPLNATLSNQLFPIAMTLRDCTCFAQIDKFDGSVKIRFGDFDWKDPGVKFARWQRDEAELIDSGFYTSSYLHCGGIYYRSPTLCLLEHTQAAKTRRPDLIRITDRNDIASDSGLSKSGDGNQNGTYTYETDTAKFRSVLERFRIDTPNHFPGG